MNINDKIIHMEGKILFKKMRGQQHSYGFRFIEGVSDMPVQLRSVGWEIQTDQGYNWDGRKRKDPDSCLFQYTLSGAGRLEIDGVVHRIIPGEAFLVNIPGDHHYYYSDKDTHWEFIYLTFFENNLMPKWRELQKQCGHILKISIDSPVIMQLNQIYEGAVKETITDKFIASSLVYTFVMECYRAVNASIYAPPEQKPAPIVTAIRFIEKYYSEDIRLEDLACEVRLSKYHFARLFSKSVGLSPAQYIRKIRIEKAVQLLNQTEHSVEQIGRSVGFSNGNYFCKVFRKMVGTSPERFREGKDIYSVGEWKLR